MRRPRLMGNNSRLMGNNDNSRRGGEVIMMWALLPVESSNNKLMGRPPCPAFTFHQCVKGLEFNDVFFLRTTNGKRSRDFPIFSPVT